jgi:nitrogen fixation/metabolism regulation signal transduction histidine kinase
MGVEARSVAPAPGAPKRQLRNYLLDRRFQLKYTSMVVAVTMVVASILGTLAYQESKGQTEALQIQLATQPDLDPGVSAQLEEFGRQRDREILVGIIGGVALLTIALGLTGIIVTHKMVGPAYKMRMIFDTVGKGHLRVEGGLRKGDELKDVFSAFMGMMDRIRSRRELDLESVDAAINEANGNPQEAVRILNELRIRMKDELS